MKRKLRRFWWKLHDKYLVKRKLSFAGWLHHKFKGKYCWADCVGWAYNPARLNPFKIENSNACCEESKTHSTNMCYCGGWNNGVCYDLLSKEEKQKMKDEFDKQETHLVDGLPF